MIITCDDFGIHPDIDQAILELCSNGKTDAVSVISCGENYDYSIHNLLNHKSAVKIGLHATWVGEQSLLPAHDISSLVSKNKIFPINFKLFYFKWKFGLIKTKHIKMELEAQILNLLGKVENIDHLDSHQHIHMIPDIFQICIELAEKYNIPRIRLVNEEIERGLPRLHNPIRWVGEKLMSNWEKTNITKLENSSVKYTENYFGLRYSGNYHLISNYLKRLIITERNSDIEINFHPAIITQSLLDQYPWYKNAHFDNTLLLNI